MLPLRVLYSALLATATVAALSACESSPTEVVPTECTSELTLGPLDVGEFVQVSGTAARLLCPEQGGDGIAEFVLVLHAATGPSADTANPTRLDLTLRSSNLRVAGAEPSLIPSSAAAEERSPDVAMRAGAGGEPGMLWGDPLEHGPSIDHAQHLGMREIEARELGPLVGAASTREPAAVSRRSHAASSVPAVGSLVEYNAQSQSACTDPIYRTGRVEAVSQRAVVVADTMNPSGGFDTAYYQSIALTYDTLVAPVTEEGFGSPSDIDANGRVILFFTQEVNRLAQAGGNQFVAGFFFSRDLFPRDQPSGGLNRCEHSNEAEILYLLVPDPNGEAGSVSHTREEVERFTPSTLAHELQHLINAVKRLENPQPAPNTFERIWLNEGLSHVAEERLFFRASGLSPRSNLDVPRIQAGGARAVAAFNEHQILNASRLRSYLRAPSSNSPYFHRDLVATRGAMWHFLRYAADRKGGAEEPFFRGLLTGTQRGFANLASAVGSQSMLEGWMADWSVSLYADSRVPGIPSRFRDASWNHPSILQALGQDSGGYPIDVVSLPSNGERQRTITAGGSAYVRFALNPGGSGAIEILDGTRSPPPSLRATLLRIR